jgi:hypothetical protein
VVGIALDRIDQPIVVLVVRGRFLVSLDIVQIDLDLVSHAIRYVLQLVHVLQLRLVARLRSIGRGIVRVVHHVVLLFAVAIEIQTFQLVRSFGGGGLVVLEEVDEGSYVLLARVWCVLRRVYKPSCSS